MENYKDMYYKLFNSLTGAIEILQETQRETEDMYISAGESALKRIERDSQKSPAE